MLIGAHVSTAGGVQNAPANGQEIGCETIALFSKNQRQWLAKPYTEEQVETFRDGIKETGLREVVVHDSYLINLGAPKEEVWKKSVAAFRDEMLRCKALGIPYLNFHPGAHVGEGEEVCIRKIVATLQALLSEQEDNPTMLLVENTAGQGTNVGYRFEHVGAILDGVGDERMGACLDTQHTFAAEYDLSDDEGYDKTLAAFDDHVGLGRLRAFHLNDSKTGLGSRVDRHENIGEGAIGVRPFQRLVNDPRFAGVAGILETPGGPPVWQEEIALLRSWRKEGAPDHETGLGARPAH
ncbi:MAG: deoxyribonuclease IV [Euryarchaeota archaeon]|nr:deoxyribonuclease IV [Euryarchaeota archaeon]